MRTTSQIYECSSNQMNDIWSFNSGIAQKFLYGGLKERYFEKSNVLQSWLSFPSKIHLFFYVGFSCNSFFHLMFSKNLCLYIGLHEKFCIRDMEATWKIFYSLSQGGSIKRLTPLEKYLQMTVEVLKTCFG